MSKNLLRRPRGLGVVVVAALLAVSVGVAGERTNPDVRDAFKKLKSLVGRWDVTTSEGRKASVTYDLRAGGTALFERFVEEGPDREDMITAFHIDGDRLMLTHFCSAGNQPRMVARGLEGATLRFDFADATNLPGPEAGHIHTAIFHFEDPDHFISEWTWYENGEPSHTSVRRHERVADER